MLSRCCILFVFYIKPQLVHPPLPTPNRCILFVFYIKPQHLAAFVGFYVVVSYLFSTSNHNYKTI